MFESNEDWKFVLSKLKPVRDAMARVKTIGVSEFNSPSIGWCETGCIRIFANPFSFRIVLNMVLDPDSPKSLWCSWNRKPDGFDIFFINNHCHKIFEGKNFEPELQKWLDAFPLNLHKAVLKERNRIMEKVKQLFSQGEKGDDGAWGTILDLSQGKIFGNISLKQIPWDCI